jgi:hypothetical protein
VGRIAILEKMLKKLFRIVKYMFVTLTVIVIGGLVYLYEPHILISEVRTTGALETIHASWGMACGEEFISEIESEHTIVRLKLATPEGGEPLEQSVAAVKDNEFVITGYRYTTVRRNIFSGQIEKIAGPRFDVVSWHVVTPYRVHDGNVDTKEVSTPLGWSSNGLNQKFSVSRELAKGNC